MTETLILKNFTEYNKIGRAKYMEYVNCYIDNVI